MTNIGGSIEAILTLNANEFDKKLSASIKLVNEFESVVKSTSSSAGGFSASLRGLLASLDSVNTTLSRFTGLAKESDSFNKFANGVKALSSAVQILGNNSKEATLGLEKVKGLIADWGNALNGIEVKVKGVGNSVKEMSSSSNQSINSTTQQFNQMRAGLNALALDITRNGNVLTEQEARMKYVTQQLRQEYGLTGEKLAQLRSQIMSAGGQLREFSLIDMEAIESEQLHRASLEALSNQLRSLYGIESEVIAKEEQEVAVNNQLVASEERVAGATNQATSSMERQASATSTASSRANQMTTSVNRLSKAMSSLKMIGSLVASMMVWNFASSLITATRETVNAKSEMEGYFKMLGFAQSDVDSFNQTLNETVSQFQRVNKYSLGETIASIGVEFNLTTEEMKKAMKVTSMITSEYLRAGRNANEASLAVKDVLQGQFQRLSRETGVKGEQLKEAGWSGDTNDVMGLMSALEKVALSRNWDVFAEKANSLNDIVTILQNRFGEWSAEMVYTVQPFIVDSFNNIMTVSTALGGALSSVWEWLNGDGWDQVAVRIGLVTTALVTGLGALISYRTGANLVQMVQMGLKDSLIATVFGLEAETVATYGSRTAIISRITSIEAETVATMGSRNAILSKILGLNAELVANSGLKEAIMENVLANKMQEIALMDVTTMEKVHLASLAQEKIAEMSTTKVILGKIASVNMETLAEKGLMVALAERVGISPALVSAFGAETVAELSTVQATVALSVALIPTIASLGVLIAVFGSLAMQTMETTEKMSKFYDLLNNGTEIVNKTKDVVKGLEERIDSLKETQSKYAKGSKEYKNVGKAIDDLNGKLETAKQNSDYAYEAYQRVVSAQNNYDIRKQEAQLFLQRKINEALVDTGLSAEEASEISNTYLRDANEGSEHLYNTLQQVVHQYELSANAISDYAKYLDDNTDLTPQQIADKVRDATSQLDKIALDMEEMELATDIVTVATKWVELQFDEIKWTFTENEPKFRNGDWAGGLTGVLKGLAHGLAKLPIAGDFWNYVFAKTGFKNNPKYTGKGMEGLVTWIGDVGWWVGKGWWKLWLDGFEESAKKQNDPIYYQLPLAMENVLEGAFEGLNSTIDNLFPHWSDFIDNWNARFQEELENTTINNVFDLFAPFFNSLFSEGTFWDLADIVMGDLGSIGSRFSDLLVSIFGDGLEDVPSKIYEMLTQGFANSALGTAITSILQETGLSLITDWIKTNVFDRIAGLSNYVYNIANNLGKSFEEGLRYVIQNIPILSDILRFLGIIPQANGDAKSKGQNLGKSIVDGFRGAIQGALKGIMHDEIEYVKNEIMNNDASKKAYDWAKGIVNSIKSAFQTGSPGVIARVIVGDEFGTYVPNAIRDSMGVANTVAQEYAYTIIDGISSVNNASSILGFADEYQADAQVITTSSEMMGTTTTDNFNAMQLAVNSTTATMGTDVANTYTSMQSKQQSSLETMKNKNTTAFNDMYTKSNQSLIHMRDSTSQVTEQMTQAWSHMKDQIVKSADRLKVDSTNHFNQLSNTIGAFYRKIQNPSSWGSAGSPRLKQGARKPSTGRRIASGFAGGSPSWNGRSTMSVGALKRKICPNGDCGDIFDGFSTDEIIDVATFLSSVVGEHGFGWNTWSPTHYNYIKNKSDAWDTGSPVIALKGGIKTGTKFKVGEFNNGQPKISFSEFQGMAESIFSAIPYRLYYDSSWKGSWLGALQAGACNCWDGAHALLAFANTCGFTGSIEHGTWANTGTPHVWAVINGKKMDTTAWQQRRSWSAGGTSRPSGSPPMGNKTVNITIDMKDATIYGVDDLDSKMEEAVKRGLREEFNDSYTIGIV